MTGEPFILTEEMLPCLPEKFQPIAKLIGLEKASALIRRCEGIQLFIGRLGKWADYQILEDTIGRNAIEELVNGYGKRQVYIPRINRIHQRYRDVLIQRRLLAGETIEELSMEYKICCRHVYEITKPVRKSMSRRKSGKP